MTGEGVPQVVERAMRTPDGRRLRVQASEPAHESDGGAGAAQRLIVLEAGLGGTAEHWAAVRRSIGDRARVVAYDRAGYGGSDPATGPRDLERLADDLALVLDAALQGWGDRGAVSPPRVVLVGHSWGGPIVRVLAARRIGDARLAGLVLVDPSDEHAAVYGSRAMRWGSALQQRLYAPLARLRLLGPLVRSTVARLPEPHRTAAARDAGSLDAARAMAAEEAHVVPELQCLLAAPLELGELPVTILSGRHAGRLERATRDALSHAHRTSAEGLAGGRYVEALRSGHLVPLDEPHLVADEALALLTRP